MMPAYEILMRIACKYDLVFNPQKTHMKAQAINFFGCLYDANGVHPDLGKVNAVHALLAATNISKLQVLRPSHIPKSLHPWSVHLDCPSVRTAQEGHRLHLELHI